MFFFCRNLLNSKFSKIPKIYFDESEKYLQLSIVCINIDPRNYVFKIVHHSYLLLSETSECYVVFGLT